MKTAGSNPPRHNPPIRRPLSSDPLGAKSLFDSSASHKHIKVGKVGKLALFSAPTTKDPSKVSRKNFGQGSRSKMGKGSGKMTAAKSFSLANFLYKPLVVHCSSCQGIKKMSVMEFFILQAPFGLFIPKGQFSWRMICPMCRHRRWVKVSLDL
ncbi:MAG: hypothetical protein M1483_05160 [Actinobacteria bacterium]|nr:hypothetical protein [Actinomycetota bacterium]MCL6105003.1 hypothetical protein [Actinomycetota bacterium]